MDEVFEKRLPKPEDLNAMTEETIYQCKTARCPLGCGN